MLYTARPKHNVRDPAQEPRKSWYSALRGCHELLLFEELGLQRVQSIVITYAAAIWARGKGWMAVRALQLCEELLLKGIQPDVFIHSSDQCVQRR